MSNVRIDELADTIEAMCDITQPIRPAITRPVRPGGRSCFTSVGKARSGFSSTHSARSRPVSGWYSRKAMMPGRTTSRGTSSLRKPANTTPICPCQTLFAARVRWVMNWLQPQYQRFASHIPPKKTPTQGSSGSSQGRTMWNFSGDSSSTALNRPAPTRHVRRGHAQPVQAQERDGQAAQEQHAHLDDVGVGHGLEAAVDRVAAPHHAEDDQPPGQRQPEDRMDRQAPRVEHHRQLDEIYPRGR